MSLWHCYDHGLTGPMACCSHASRCDLITKPAPSRFGVIWNSILSAWDRLVAAILDAQEAVGPNNDARYGRALVDSDYLAADEPDTPLAPALATPDLVGALVARDQYDEHTIASRPIRSSTADAKRAALRYAEERAGRPLTLKSARRLLAQWERLERERSLDPAAPYITARPSRSQVEVDAAYATRGVAQ